MLYSDGITEATRPLPGSTTAPLHPSEMEFFDEARLLAAVTAHSQESAAAIMAGVLLAVREFSGDQPQEDDMTLLIVKFTG